MSDWYVGQKVVCITNMFYRPSKGCDWPIKGLEKGAIYTVSGFRMCKNMPHLFLFEIQARPFLNGEPRGYPPQIFRPLLEKPTDISIFTEMLNTTNLELVK